MADTDFVLAVPPGGGDKRLVPAHYLDNPAFGFKLPPSERTKVTEPAAAGDASLVQEPAAADTTETVEEPAAATTKTTKRSGAAGETKEA